MVTSLLASLALGQNRAPERPVQVVPTWPVFVADAAPAQPLEWQVATTSVRLETGTATFSLLASWRNPNTTPVTGTMRLPFFSFGTAAAPVGEVKASWNRADLSPVPRSAGTGIRIPGRGSAVFLDQVAAYDYSVAFPPRGTGSFRAEFTVAIPKVALGDVARQFAFYIPGTTSPVGQAQFAIQYREETVFGVLNAQGPLGAFQVGPRGAFVKQDAKPLSEGYVLFRFYPGS